MTDFEAGWRGAAQLIFGYFVTHPVYPVAPLPLVGCEPRLVALGPLAAY